MPTGSLVTQQAKAGGEAYAQAFDRLLVDREHFFGCG
jgi:hypothetical protein